MIEDGSEDLEVIKREILKDPNKEFYPGLFDDLRQIKDELDLRALLRNRPRPAWSGYQEKADLSLKANLIRQWRRRQTDVRRESDNSGTDN